MQERITAACCGLRKPLYVDGITCFCRIIQAGREARDPGMPNTVDILTKTVVPAIGVIISVGMYLSPLRAVLKADKAGCLGVSITQANRAGLCVWSLRVKRKKRNLKHTRPPRVQGKQSMCYSQIDQFLAAFVKTSYPHHIPVGSGKTDHKQIPRANNHRLLKSSEQSDGLSSPNVCMSPPLN